MASIFGGASFNFDPIPKQLDSYHISIITDDYIYSILNNKIMPFFLEIGINIT